MDYPIYEHSPQRPPKTQPSEIRALNFEKEEVGDIIPMSKHRIVWHFTLDTVLHKVELFDSKLTTRRRVVIDHQLRFDSGSQSFFGNDDFYYQTKIDNT
jgi:hypothetical protein